MPSVPVVELDDVDDAVVPFQEDRGVNAFDISMRDSFVSNDDDTFPEPKADSAVQ